MSNRYYHAGVEVGGTIVWSDITHESFDSAADEARSSAESGGRAVVESWDAAHGSRPGDCDAVDEAHYC